MNSSNKWIYLPIGTKVRELYAKIFFSCIAAENNYNVLIGGKGTVLKVINYLPQGVYIDTLINEGVKDRFKRLKEEGHFVAAWDEEGLVYTSPEAYLKERVSVEALRYLDLIFAWGKEQSDVIKTLGHKDIEEKIIVSGNPRTDILRPSFRQLFSDEARKIQECYSPMILINTNFDLYNHCDGRDVFIERLKSHKRILNDEMEKWFLGWSDFRGELFYEFIEMIKRLSLDYKNYNIVIRPHPSESHEVWKDHFSDFRNVKVIHEDSVIPWILSSKVVIHNSCTTAVESYLLDVPAVAYCPVRSNVYESDLPNDLSTKTETYNELYESLESILINGNSLDESGKVGIGNSHIACIEGDLSSEVILEALKKYDSCNNEGEINDGYLLRNRQTSEKIKSLFALHKMTKVVTRRLRNILNNKTEKKDAMQRFPGITLEEVRQILNKLQIVSNRFAGVKVERMPYNKNLFKIYK